MKECCKTGNDKPKSSIGKILNWLLYAIIIGALVFIVFSQFFKT